MPYTFYLDDMQLPFAPPSISVATPGRNEVIDLINDGQASILRQPGLREIEFTARIPQQRYPFANYPNGWVSPDAFETKIRSYRDAKKPLRLIITRTLPNGAYLFDTNMLVSVTELEHEEDAEEGFDVFFSIALQEYKQFSTKVAEIVRQTSATNYAVVSETRPSTFVTPTDYTVVSGDCLSHIAARLLGDSSRWREIYELNKSKIKNPNKIYVGQVFKMP